MIRFSTLALCAALALPASTLVAQKMEQTGVGHGGSPHVTTSWNVGGAAISISYGRPYLKGRDEAKMMPRDSVWRTGADEATVITSNKPLTFGKVTLPAGSHTINTLVRANDWELLLGKLDKPGQWGIPYQSALELGRVPMTLGKAKAPAEQVTYSIDEVGKTHVLRIEWGTKSATVPFTVGS